MSNKIITLKRVCHTPYGTFSIVEDEGVPFQLAGELPWKDNRPNVSCVPEGEYPLKRFYSMRFKMWTYKLMDVAGRSDCEFHPANTFCDDPETEKNEKQVDGCIANGRRFEWFGKILGLAESKIAHNDFMWHMDGVEMAKLIILNI